MSAETLEKLRPVVTDRRYSRSCHTEDSSEELKFIMERKKMGSAMSGSLLFGKGPREMPTVVYEIQSEFVVGARLLGSPAGVRRMVMARLSPGLLQPSSTQSNISDTGELGRSLGKLRGTLGNGARWGLLVPDAVARINVLRFETLPEKPAEVEALLRWRIRESLGFPPEEARLTYQVTQREAGSIELLVVAVKDGVLSQYEAACEPLQRDSASLILPVTLPLLALLPESEPAGQLLTHAYSGCVTHAVVEGNRLRFWRSRPLAEREPEAQAEEVLAEAARAVASARDRVGIQVGRAWHCIRTDASEALSQRLSSLLGMPVN